MAKPSTPTGGVSHLRPVPDSEVAEEEAAPQKGGKLPILLAVLLFGALLGWVLAWQDGRRLESELATSQAALARAEGRVEALTTTLGDARERASGVLLEVDGVRDRLAELEALLLGGEAAPAARETTGAGADPLAGEAAGPDPLSPR